MAVFIEQSQEQVKRSFNVQRHTEIVDVRLRASSIESNPKSIEFPPVSISVGHESKVEPLHDGTLSTTIDFELSASPEGDDSICIFRIKCSFRVTYKLQEGYQPTDEETAAFAAANAVFNVWPYFREFAQNSCLRLGVSNVPLIPFLKLVPKPEEKAPSEAGVEKPIARTRQAKKLSEQA